MVGEEDGFAFDFDLYNYYLLSNHLHLLLGVWSWRIDASFQ
ncbi:MAG: hypothetical protein R3F43_07160 [bacterium]